MFGVMVLLMAAAAFQVSAGITGEEVMERVYDRPAGDDMTAQMLMGITNARGSTRDRDIVQFSMDAGGIDKKLMFFTSPADVRDTSFMTWSYEDGSDDDQWIYLPALRRVRRIASDSRHDSFMGSDFTYDDLSQRHPSADDHALLREEQVNGSDAYVVESVPVDDEPYSRTVSWISKDSYIGLQREFYDDAGRLYKKLVIDQAEEIDGYWVITDMTMSNLSSGSNTRIQMKDVSFSIGLDDSFFSERQMRLGPPRR